MKELKIFEAPLTGFSLVEAGAGTGKTYNITSIYVRAIIERGLMPKNILVLTFTNAAAAELRSRIRQRINQAINVYETGNTEGDTFLEELTARLNEENYNLLKQALYSLDEATISTFHSFCNNLLREDYIEFGVQPNFELVDAKDELFEESIDNYWHNFIKESEDDTAKSIVLGYLLDQEYNPKKLAKYISEFNPRSDTQILPDIQISAGNKSLYDELGELYVEMQKQYANDNAELRKLMNLDEIQIFSIEVYRQYNAYAKELDVWFSGKNKTPGFIDSLQVFSNKYLTDKVYKKFKSMFIFPNLCRMVDRFLDLLEQIEVAFLKDAIQTINNAYIEEKRNKNLFTFDDLIGIIAEKIGEDKSGAIAYNIASKYPLALIDEFQDTDEEQYKIFKTIYWNQPNTGLFMIGDPKQAIYSFRGADLYTYFKARNDVPQKQRYSLLHNYRSSDSMIDAVNQLFNHKENAFLLDELKFNNAKPPIGKKDFQKLYNDGVEVTALQFIKVGEDVYSNKTMMNNDIRSTLLAEIKNLLSGSYKIDDKALKASDIAVLVHKNSEALDIKVLLALFDLPSVIISKESVFNTDEAQDLLLILKAILSSGSESYVRAALTTELIGYTVKNLHEFIDNERKRTEISILFGELLKIWKEKGVRECISKLNSSFKLVNNISRYFDGERRITNYYHLIELLSGYETEEHASPSVLLRYLNEKVSSDTQQNSKDDEIIRLESDEELISIVTQHSSKGLEYPIVFIASTWESINTNKPGSGKKAEVFSFHSGGDTYKSLSLPLADPEHYTQSRFEDLAEKIRLFYVSLTRAAVATYIPFLETKKEHFSPIKILLHRHNDNLLEDLRGAIYSKGDFNLKMADVLENFSKKENIEIRDGAEYDDFKLRRFETPKETYNPKAKEFSRTDAFDYPRVTSYSALTDKRTEPTVYEVRNESEARDLDETPVSSPDKEDKIPESDNAIFNLPKGADTGNLIHNILELVDFKSDETMVDEATKEVDYFGLDERQKEVVLSWIQKIVSHPILTDGTALNGLNNDNLTKEMEFYFPIESINVEEVEGIIRNRQNSAPQLSENHIRGYLKGFIDLFFKHKGKYYILDYKTNHLGENYQNYDVGQLKEAIISDNYDIQYNIYTVAAHRFLKNKVKDYSYERDFGGVIYLFVRGLNDADESQGVYFEKPDFAKIEALNQLFKKGV